MDHFNIAELGELYFHLSLDRETLVGANPTKRDLVISLIETCQRQEQMPALLAQCRQLRPQVFPTDIEYVGEPAALRIPEQARGCYIFLGRFKFALVLSLPVFFFITLYSFISLFSIESLVSSGLGALSDVPPPSSPGLPILPIGLYALIYGGLTGLIQWQILRVNGRKAKGHRLILINMIALLVGKLLTSTLFLPFPGDFVLAALVVAAVQWRFFWREISGGKWTAVLVGFAFSITGWLGLLVMMAGLAWLVLSSRMNKTRLIFILTLPFIFIAVTLLLLVDYAEIAFMSQADTILVAENETIKGTLFNFGDATIEDGATIDGDVVLMGGNLNLGRVVVTGDVVLIGDSMLKITQESVIQGKCFAYQIRQPSTESQQAACQKALIPPLATMWVVIVQLARLRWGVLLFLFVLGAAWIFLIFSPKTRMFY